MNINNQVNQTLVLIFLSAIDLPMIRLLEKRKGYSSVPNRRVGQNKRAGGKILKKHLTCKPKKKTLKGEFFPQINKRAGPIPTHV